MVVYIYKPTVTYWKLLSPVVGTLGHILGLAHEKCLKLDHINYFVLDECDCALKYLDMRRDIQEVFKITPHKKQVIMFSATLSKEIQPVCKKFCRDPMEMYVDGDI